MGQCRIVNEHNIGRVGFLMLVILSQFYVTCCIITLWTGCLILVVCRCFLGLKHRSEMLAFNTSKVLVTAS